MQLETFTLCLTYYRNREMLRRQLAEILRYPLAVKVIIVDDGSPEPAADIVQVVRSVRERVELYRIDVDIPWNREGARNLATTHVTTPWLVHLDIDHVMPHTTATSLLKFEPKPGRWYQFARWRVGAADETRKKDAAPPTSTFCRIHSHWEAGLLEAAVYHEIGGYDEDYAGVLGGGGNFLRRLDAKAQRSMLPPDLALHVYTRNAIPDASDQWCSRDTTRGAALDRAKGMQKPARPLRFPWHKVAL